MNCSEEEPNLTPPGTTGKEALAASIDALRTRPALSNWKKGMAWLFWSSGFLLIVAGSAALVWGFTNIEALQLLISFGFTYVGFGLAVVAIGFSYRLAANDKDLDIAIAGISALLLSQQQPVENVHTHYHHYEPKQLVGHQPDVEIPEGAHGNYIS